MKISPIDIRQHTFEKEFRGYVVDEVNAFLNSLSQEWERVMNENKMLKMQLEIAEKELNKLRDVEMTLFRTLKTAEDTSNQITEQANRAAEKYIQESRQKTDETIVEARRKASMIIQDAENESKYIREEIINELKNQERDFRAMEKYRDNLVVQLKSLANNTHEAVERFEKKFSKDPSFDQRMEEIKNQAVEAETPSEKKNPASKGEQVPTGTDEAEPTQEPEISDAENKEAEPEESTAEEISAVAEEPQADESQDEELASEPSAEGTPPDAAEEALAEVEKMAHTRQQTQDLDVANTPPKPEGDSETKPQVKGSFFDQIG
ncbi:DivIVA domain-containing protein [Salmonirosea aquatica]|uniref:DivIVA domain-containing protein n=1 Tax=Salmonirosea aquatica TaxID=2654236 RepID=A0A7C9BE63_9BACT|nr:DivIVA domain-containing protein [Cytophagaceae bacterium SJW1-29]